ncbi:hypothetical protein [Alkalicoccobacillus gibsonii]|uniref:hypothetical protein n=1 Tax=Alkalicoccobacillus gibsonii TaxID=79881 RepID=UPI0019329E9B|nr:hypothetical protein [Alkalicoccobacillus gibsonii]MBM0067949.1 hypothetical protein [Alkalicoccobacillus gibsonii]
MVLFFGEDMEVGVVQSVYQDETKNSVVLIVRDEEYTIFLSDEEFRKLQIHFQNQENLVIPINMKTKELFLDTDQTELEEALEELVEAADRGGEE